jgi:hypothetical protein
MNMRFTRAPVSKEYAHVPLLNAGLTEILCFEYERVVANDYTVRFENRQFQILKEKGDRPLPEKPVTVRKKLDRTISVLWNGKPLKIKEILPSKVVKQPESAAA